MDTKQDEVDMISVLHQIKGNELFRNSNISELYLDDLKFGVINLKTGEILFRHGDSAESIYLIIEGEINLIKDQGIGKTHSCLCENKFFGHEEYFVQTRRNSIAIALKDSCIVELSKENLEILFSRDNSFLDNIKNPSSTLDPSSKNNFKDIIKELPGFLDKPSIVFPMELKTTNDELPEQCSYNDTFSPNDSKITVYNKIDLNKIKFEINTIINKFNQNLLLLEEEKNKLESLKTVYEDDNTRLLVEIEKLKEQEAALISLDKEKTEILGRQSYRIIELEEENTKFAEIESGYLKKIELIKEQLLKDETTIRTLAAEVKDKGLIISNLENDFEKTKIELADLKNTILILTRKTEDQEQLIKKQKIKLEDSQSRIEQLASELSSKEVSLTKLNEDLLNKNNIISLQNETVKKANSDLEQAQKYLNTKDAEIQSQSAKIEVLQNMLDYQKEVEKHKNEYILNQTNKITEYEDILRNSKIELEKKEETIINFVREIQDYSEKLSLKEREIKEQNKIIGELKDEIAANLQSTEEHLNKEKEFKKNIADLEFHLSKANSKLISLSEQVEDKSKQVEIKEKENAELQNNLDIFQHNLKDRDGKINKLDAIVAQLKIELSESSKSKEDYELFIKDFQTLNDAYNEQINLNKHLSEKIKNLELLDQKNKNDFRNLISVKDEQNSDLKKGLEASNNILIEKNHRICELEDIIKQLKEELSESYKIKDEFNYLKTKLTEKTNLYDTLKGENEKLLEQINNLKVHNNEKENKSQLLQRLSEELNKLKSKETDYKNSIIDKDKSIDERNEIIENIKASNSELLKTLSQIKDNFKEDIKKRDDQIYELANKLKHVQITLDEKLFSEEQYVRTIENQAQKIAELKLQISESNKVESDTNKFIKDANIVKAASCGIVSDKPPDNEDIFSKSKLIDHKYHNSSLVDGDIEHFEYFDLDIINVNMLRATMDIAFVFNELLQKIISVERNKIIVNVLQCEFIDSSIIGALVSNLKKATSMGGDLRLVGFHPGVKTMLELTRMNRVFESFSEIETAIKSFD